MAVVLYKYTYLLNLKYGSRNNTVGTSYRTVVQVLTSRDPYRDHSPTRSSTVLIPLPDQQQQQHTQALCQSAADHTAAAQSVLYCTSY